MKHATSCTECRSAKRKCVKDPEDSDSACLSCQSREIQCSKVKSKQNLHRILPSVTPKVHQAPSTSFNEPNDWEATECSENIHEFVRLYLHFIHGRPHSLFHEQSLWKALGNGSLPDSLTAAICSLGCRFATEHSQRNLARIFILRSKSLLAEQLEDISVTNVQTCILLANSYAAEQNNRLEALYFGIANRMAYVLGLHQENPDDSPIMLETKLRVWWSLFMADKWCPPGLGLPREIISSHPTVSLPMDEVDFQQLRATDEGFLVTRRNGIWAYNTTLADVLTAIQDVNLALVQGETYRSVIDRQVDTIADRLHNWQESLPEHMVMNDRNLAYHREKGQGGTFVALHLGYHHYSALLYFQFLEPDRNLMDKAAAYAARCQYHGLAFSRLLHAARELGDCHVVYLTVAHMTIVSSSVLLHLLLFGTDEEVETARTQLTRNFQVLDDLQKYWPCVDQMKERLFIFQDACLHSSAAKTYAVDRWIMRFLLQYALPFGKKNGVSDVEMDNTANISPLPHTTISLERRAFLGKALEAVWI